MATALTRRCILKIAKNRSYAKFDFRPCSQVMASGVGTSTEVDTLPVCSVWEVVYLSGVSRKVARVLSQRCILKIEINRRYPIITQISIFRPCSQVMAGAVGMSTEANTPLVSSLWQVV